MKKYTTLESVCQYIGIDTPSESDPLGQQLLDWIEVASLEMDKRTKRILHSEDTKTFYYDGDGTTETLIDEVREPEVKINGEERLVIKYPLNEEYTNRLYLNTGFPKGKANIEVKGKVGMFSEIPDNLQFVCNLFVSLIYHGQKTQGMEGTTEKIGDYSISYANAKDSDVWKANSYLSIYEKIIL